MHFSEAKIISSLQHYIFKVISNLLEIKQWNRNNMRETCKMIKDNLRTTQRQNSNLKISEDKSRTTIHFLKNY